MGVELGTEHLAVGMVEVLLVQLKRERKRDSCAEQGKLYGLVSLFSIHKHLYIYTENGIYSFSDMSALFTFTTMKEVAKQ